MAEAAPTETESPRTAPTKRPPKKEAEAAVRLRQVTKRFGAKTAVDAVSFSIARGAVFGLIGPNGAGKTTTFSMMAGYLHPTSGSLEVLGYPPASVDELRRASACCRRTRSCLRTIRWASCWCTWRACRTSRPARLSSRRERRWPRSRAPTGGSRSCGSLSHGMAKRVALAQAFLG